VRDMPPIQSGDEPGAAKSPESATRRVFGRPWVKGQSGNPKGMPRGSRHKRTLLLEGLMGERGDELVKKAVELGISGDAASLKICLDRILPPPKSRPFRFKLPPLHTIGDAQEALAQIIAGTAKGLILADEATALTGMVNAFVKTIEVAELETRVLALEQGERAQAEEHRYDA
jgi:Family of unknown function (DUF5681)